MRFGAVSSQLLALGSQLSYTPYREDALGTSYLIFTRGGYATVSGSGKNSIPA